MRHALPASVLQPPHPPPSVLRHGLCSQQHLALLPAVTITRPLSIFHSLPKPISPFNTAVLGVAVSLSSAWLVFAAALSARTSTPLCKGNQKYISPRVVQSSMISSHLTFQPPPPPLRSRAFHQWLASSRRRSARSRLSNALSLIITRCRKYWVIRHLRFFCFSAAAGTALAFSTFCESTNTRF